MVRIDSLAPGARFKWARTQAGEEGVIFVLVEVREARPGIPSSALARPEDALRDFGLAFSPVEEVYGSEMVVTICDDGAEVRA